MRNTPNAATHDEEEPDIDAMLAWMSEQAARKAQEPEEEPDIDAMLAAMAAEAACKA